MAPLDFIGRYMDDWFDYAICDEAHQLANDTAQGNGLGTLAACAGHTLILTGTLLGGYASDVYNLLFRVDARKMVGHGYEWGEAGLSDRSPKPTAYWNGLPPSNRRTTVARRRV